jgi:hypothetical protein
LIADQPSFARAGGLAAYGINRSWPFRRLAHLCRCRQAPQRLPAEGRCGAFRGAGSCRPEW